MATGRFHALLYGGLVVFLGPGSMFFHGSLTHYGGWLDNFSMILYVTFILCYDAARIWRWDDRIGTFAGIFVAINIALGLLTWFADGSGTILFAISPAWHRDRGITCSPAQAVSTGDPSPARRSRRVGIARSSGRCRRPAGRCVTRTAVPGSRRWHPGHGRDPVLHLLVPPRGGSGP
jgi:hypothetical protein